MSIEQIPTAGLGVVVAAYWAFVGVMVVRVGWKSSRMRRMVVPALRMERFMMILWAPLVWAWINLPLAAVLLDPQRFPILELPGFVHAHASLTSIRFAALGAALVCLLGSIHCWRFMGNNWRMAIDPCIERRLIQDGPFALVRHPIYALSIALMICSALILPNWPMLAVAAIHISLILLKARNEESFLHERFGLLYEDYCRRTGRFAPRFSLGRIDRNRFVGRVLGRLFPGG
jgi:protein-S-isoprenylcysteine O-methyltransferase Ste14